MSVGSPRPSLRTRFLDASHFVGASPALVAADGTVLDYADVGERIDAVIRRLGPVRRLVHIEIRNDVDAIVWYLGALAGGHVVALTSGAPTEAARIANDRFRAVYRPDVSIAATPTADGHGDHWAVVEHHATSAHALHPDLAVLLSTSGSTGSPKLVRLSRENLTANAAAIAESLTLGPDDRAVTTLPLQYCYGLSVLHSHLQVGASIVVSDTSVVDPCFWAAVERTRPTTLAGVPHTFDLLDRVDFADRAWPELRVVTQAGGRLAPDRVRDLATTGARAGWDFVVMYGQTEATARMAYLPPALAAEHPGTVGVPIPGTAIEIDPGADDAPGTGEVVFRGPNVMMGYAEGPDDLALDPTCTEIRTGDVGRWNDAGLLEIVGRRRDFIKVFGLRVDLGEVAAAVADDNIDARVDGDDDGIVIAVHDEHPPRVVADRVAARFGFPGRVVAAAHVEADAVPRFDHHKVDRPALRALVRAHAGPAVAPHWTEPGGHGGTASPSTAGGDGAVAEIYRRLLAVDVVGDDDTFVSLGGDSLSYVEVSIALEAALGDVPADWHHRPVGSLTPSGRRSRFTTRVDTSVVLRAVAIVTIVGSHAEVFRLIGGAHLLLAVAGFNFARFGIGAAKRWRPIMRIAVPAMVWIAAMTVAGSGFDLRHIALVRSLDTGEGRWAYWFIEAIVMVLVVATATLAIPAVARFERRRPFATAAIATALTVGIRFDVVPAPALSMARFRPWEIAWFFALGWLVARSTTTTTRLATTVVVLGAVPGFFGTPSREQFIIVGLLALLWLPTLRVPRLAVTLFAPVAAASLSIYLTHIENYPLWVGRSPWLALVMSVIIGVVVHRLVEGLADRWSRGVGRRVGGLARASIRRGSRSTSPA